MDVAAWLRGLRLEQYAPAFHDNDVDGEVLPELTADDLIGLERIEDSVDYGLRRGDAAGLPRGLDAEGLDRRRFLGERHV